MRRAVSKDIVVSAQKRLSFRARKNNLSRSSTYQTPHLSSLLDAIPGPTFVLKVSMLHLVTRIGQTIKNYRLLQLHAGPLSIDMHFLSRLQTRLHIDHVMETTQANARPT